MSPANAAVIVSAAVLAIVDHLVLSSASYRLRRADALAAAGQHREAERVMAAVERDLRIPAMSLARA